MHLVIKHTSVYSEGDQTDAQYVNESEYCALQLQRKLKHVASPENIKNGDERVSERERTVVLVFCIVCYATIIINLLLYNWFSLNNELNDAKMPRCGL